MRYVVTTQSSNLNVRSGPGTEYPVMRSLSRGSTVEVVMTWQGWSRLTDGNWVSSDYLRAESDAVAPRSAVSQRLPPFASLWHNYPGGDLSAVKQLVGGQIDSPRIKNSCTIRLSRAFNYSGQPIPINFPGWVLPGADGMWYALRVREMQQYLETGHGLPEFHWSANAGDFGSETGPDPRAPFLRHRGIILFLVDFTNSTGHFDIWDGIGVRFHDYFPQAREILLWSTDR